MNLFAYGTLMWPEVFETVVGRRQKGGPCVLRGYSRRRLRGVHYPAIIPDDSAAVVEGRLYRNLSELEFSRLDRFEGDEYDRVDVCVDGVEAQAYVLSKHVRHLATEETWHPDHLRAEHLASFCEEYKGWIDIQAESI